MMHLFLVCPILMHKMFDFFLCSLVTLCSQLHTFLPPSLTRMKCYKVQCNGKFLRCAKENTCGVKMRGYYYCTAQSLAQSVKRVLIDRRSNCEWAVQHNDGVEPKANPMYARTFARSFVRVLCCVVWLSYECALHCTVLLRYGVLCVCVCSKCVSVVVVQLFTIIFHCRLFCLSLQKSNILCFFLFFFFLFSFHASAQAHTRTHSQSRMNKKITSTQKYGTIKIRSIQIRFNAWCGCCCWWWWRWAYECIRLHTQSLFLSLYCDPTFDAVLIFPTSSTEK